MNIMPSINQALDSVYRAIDRSQFRQDTIRKVKIARGVADAIRQGKVIKCQEDDRQEILRLLKDEGLSNKALTNAGFNLNDSKAKLPKMDITNLRTIMVTYHEYVKKGKYDGSINNLKGRFNFLIKPSKYRLIEVIKELSEKSSMQQVVDILINAEFNAEYTNFTKEDLQDLKFTPEILQELGFTKEDLNKLGFTPEELGGIKFTAKELEAPKEYDVPALNPKGIFQSIRVVCFMAMQIVVDLIGLSYPHKELKEIITQEGGIEKLKEHSGTSLKDAGYSLDKLIEIGCPLEFLKKAGFEHSDIEKCDSLTRAQKIMAVSEFKIKDQIVLDLIESLEPEIKAYTTMIDLKTVIQGVKSGDKIDGLCHKEDRQFFLTALKKDAKCTLRQLKGAGFSAREFKVAGYTVRESSGAGYSLGELKDAGYKGFELISSGYTARQLKEADFPVELKGASAAQDDNVSTVQIDPHSKKICIQYPTGEVKDVSFSKMKASRSKFKTFIQDLDDNTLAKLCSELHMQDNRNCDNFKQIILAMKIDKLDDYINAGNFYISYPEFCEQQNLYESVNATFSTSTSLDFLPQLLEWYGPEVLGHAGVLVSELREISPNIALPDIQLTKHDVKRAIRNEGNANGASALLDIINASDDYRNDKISAEDLSQIVQQYKEGKNQGRIS